MLLSYSKCSAHFERSFAEMPTQSYVESGFWNFDAMFVPQQHPARELQDTFYISGMSVQSPTKFCYVNPRSSSVTTTST